MRLSKGFVWATVLSAGVFSFTASAASKGGAYVGGFYGMATSSSSESRYDGLSGTVMGGQLGFPMTSSLAFEMSGRLTSFERTSYTQDLSDFGLGTADVSNEMKSTVIGAGFRQSFFRYINIVGGLSYRIFDPNTSATATNPQVAAAIKAGSKKSSGMGYFYGAGLTLPLGRVSITAEYLFNTIASDLTSKEITGGLNFYF